VLPQDVYIFNSTLHDNIGFGKEHPEKRIRDVAKLSAIDHFSLDESALGLSGGERQRVGLARALACDYDVLILDEPTSNLDQETETAIIENLKQVQKETNCIMIVVTHSANVIENLCTKHLELPKH
jgi:ABC-type bacteriocin/lantibiotic exporter with double-glycine peptidase domain